MKVKKVHVPYNYLPAQFSNYDDILNGWDALIKSSDFTLGQFVEDFEQSFAKYVGAEFCVATNNGTDALILSLKALGISTGDEVITPCNSFYATAGAIVAVGATPVFCDVDARYQADVDDMASRITARTKALLPVHWAGASPDMGALLELSKQHGLELVEDACMGIGGAWVGQHPGTFGRVGAFSMHPLKTLNVMGDGGMVVTDDGDLYEWMLMYRNHGMIDRDHIHMWGVNMRLQPLQAVVAKVMLQTLDERLAKRRDIQAGLDRAIQQNTDLTVPPRDPRNSETVSLYMLLSDKRDELLTYLDNEGIEAKIHYPVPLHLQRPGVALGYTKGRLPVAENQARKLVTVPAHEYLDEDQQQYLIHHLQTFARQNTP